MKKLAESTYSYVAVFVKQTAAELTTRVFAAVCLTNTATYEYVLSASFFIYRGSSGICVRPHRYALARTLAAPLGADEFGLHECDMPLCVKVCGADAPRRHVVIGDQGDNMRRMARMRRGGGRKMIVGDGLRTRRERSVALRAVLRERGWDRAALEAALIGDAPTLW